MNTVDMSKLYTPDAVLAHFGHTYLAETQRGRIYPILCAIGVIGVIAGVFFVATQNLPLFPGNAAPISGYALLGLSTLSFMIAYVHRKLLASLDFDLFVHLTMRDDLKTILTPSSSVCVAGRDHLKIFHLMQYIQHDRCSYSCVISPILFDAEYPTKETCFQNNQNLDLFEKQPLRNISDLQKEADLRKGLTNNNYNTYSRLV